jgi:hypothetical protein
MGRNESAAPRVPHGLVVGQMVIASGGAAPGRQCRRRTCGGRNPHVPHGLVAGQMAVASGGAVPSDAVAAAPIFRVKSMPPI